METGTIKSVFDIILLICNINLARKYFKKVAFVSGNSTCNYFTKNVKIHVPLLGVKECAIYFDLSV